MSDAEERMLLDDKNDDPTERNSRCTEETTQPRYGTTLNNLFYTTPNQTTKPAKILFTCTCITTLIIHKYMNWSFPLIIKVKYFQKNRV
jgi:hypothetical protein